MERQRGRIRLRVVATATWLSLLSARLVTIMAPAALAGQTYWMAPIGPLTADGRGFGHGRHVGTQGAALAGRPNSNADPRLLLPRYDDDRRLGSMRAWISGDTTSSIRLKPTSGLRIRDLGDNAIWTLPVTSSITQWSIEPYGNHRTQLRYFYEPSNRWIAFSGCGVFKGMAQFEGSAPKPLIMPRGGTRLYRGALRAADRSGAALDTINVLPLDEYVRGVVRGSRSSPGRRPRCRRSPLPRAPTAPSRRTGTTTCATRCQVYGGHSAEVSSTNNAVTAPAGRIRTFGGKPILAEYSSSSGGHTATRCAGSSG
jgi:hypothetical protein